MSIDCSPVAAPYHTPACRRLRQQRSLRLDSMPDCGSHWLQQQGYGYWIAVDLRRCWIPAPCICCCLGVEAHIERRHTAVLNSSDWKRSVECYFGLSNWNTTNTGPIHTGTRCFEPCRLYSAVSRRPDLSRNTTVVAFEPCDMPLKRLCTDLGLLTRSRDYIIRAQQVAEQQLQANLPITLR